VTRLPRAKPAGQWTVAGLLMAVFFCTSLGACSSHPSQQQHPAPPDDPLDAKLSDNKNEQVHTELIRQMIDKGEFYAALAHIQDARQDHANDPLLILLEAECRRELGQTARADALYRKLLMSPQAGEAYHGLGLLYVRTDLPFSVECLQRAARRLPTNAAVRNDLGRALMESGRYTEAVVELSTSAELAPDQVKSRNNLIVLMVLMGDEAAVQRLAEQAGTSPAELQGLRIQADSIRARQADRPATKSG